MATTIIRTPIHDDDGSGTTGTVLDNAWKQEFYGQIDGALAAIGAVGVPWTRIPYNAADFTGSGSMTWAVLAGGITQFDYLTVPALKLGMVMFDVVGTIGGTLSTALILRLPFTIKTGSAASVIWVQNSATAFGMLGSSGTTLSCYKDTTFATPFVAGNGRVVGQSTFQIP